MPNTLQEEYNNEPVYYCKDCLSLRIKTVVVDMDLDYCDECGSTDVTQTTIEEWQKMYKNKYGFDYLEKSF